MDGGGFDDLSDELSSIPSYDMGQDRRSGGVARGRKQEAGDTDVDDLMLFDDKNNMDMRDLDIND